MRTRLTSGLVCGALVVVLLVAVGAGAGVAVAQEDDDSSDDGGDSGGGGGWQPPDPIGGIVDDILGGGNGGGGGGADGGQSEDENDANAPGSEDDEENEDDDEEEEDDDDDNEDEDQTVDLPEDCENADELQNLAGPWGYSEQMWPNAADTIDTECATGLFIYLNTNCATLACLGGTDLQSYMEAEVCDLDPGSTFLNETAGVGADPTDHSDSLTEAERQAREDCEDFQHTFINKLESSIRGGGLIPWWLTHPGRALADFAADIAHGIEDLLDQFSDIVYGVPAPGSATDPTSWATPSSDWWQGLQVAYGLIAFVSLLLLMPAGMAAFDTSDPRRRRQSIRRVVQSVVMIAFGWLLFPVGFHGATVVADVLAPSGGEFIRTPVNFSRFGIGVVLVAILLLIESGIVLLGLLVMFVQWALAYLTAGMWPLFWSLRGQPNFYLRSIGRMGLAAYFALIVLKIIQAALARILFNLPVDGSDFLLTLLVTAVGLLLIFVVLPHMLLRLGLPRVTTIRRSRRLQSKLPDRPNLDGIRDKLSAFGAGRGSRGPGQQGTPSRATALSGGTNKAALPSGTTSTPALQSGSSEGAGPQAGLPAGEGAETPSALPPGRAEQGARPEQSRLVRRAAEIDRETTTD
ncbi:hypothetical protein [Halorientalis marina]|uniref:hypothetical protein n=1 Tax=Halorientalis marina TaxID=2931976 RepID=UPI001FF60F93|nr:hypothetical protein [Halorientalis marina]